jgi:hypothetical protein
LTVDWKSAGAVVIVAAVGAAAGLAAQRRDAFSASREHPAIAYAAREGDNRVRRLSDALESGSARLAYEEAHGRGYLRSLLDALHVPSASQVLVFSETSKQARRISPGHPRALYFSDSVAVGWVPGAEVLEIAAHDPRQGVVFYTLPQSAASCAT